MCATHFEKDYVKAFLEHDEETVETSQYPSRLELIKWIFA